MASQTLSPFVLRQLAAALPSRFCYADWRILYSTAVHGISLNTFYQKTHGCGCCLLALRDASGNVFGGFCTEWREPSGEAKFYGGGETFLYSVEKLRNLPPLPVGDEKPPDEAVHVHRWSGANSFFMLSGREVHPPPSSYPRSATGSVWPAHALRPGCCPLVPRAHTPLSIVSPPGALVPLLPGLRSSCSIWPWAAAATSGSALTRSCYTAAPALAKPLATSASAGSDATVRSTTSHPWASSDATCSKYGAWITPRLSCASRSS